MCEGVRQDLKRDVAIELRVASLIDLSHPTFADRRSDFVHAEAGAESEGQTPVGDYTAERQRPYDYSRVAPSCLSRIKNRRVARHFATSEDHAGAEPVRVIRSFSMQSARALSGSHRNEARPTITTGSLGCRRRFRAH